MNEGDNFPREVLKQLYNSIKSFPLKWAFDEGSEGTTNQPIQQGDGPAISATGNPFLDVPNVTGATEFKKGLRYAKMLFRFQWKENSVWKTEAGRCIIVRLRNLYYICTKTSMASVTIVYTMRYERM